MFHRLIATESEDEEEIISRDSSDVDTHNTSDISLDR